MLLRHCRQEQRKSTPPFNIELFSTMTFYHMQTLEMEVQVMDALVLDQIVASNGDLIEMGRTPNQGVRLMLTDANEN